MKRLLMLFTVVLIGLTITGCTVEDEEPKCWSTEELIDGECVKKEYDVVPTCDSGYEMYEGECVWIITDDWEPVFITFNSGSENLNPFKKIDPSTSQLYHLLTDSLYNIDFDWFKAIELGLATEIGDFETSGAASIPVNRFPRMASKDPIDVNGNGLVWDITLRQDLIFEDDTIIDANTFEYSWKMLLDPLQGNGNASYLFEDDKLPILNAEAYYTQNEQFTDKFGFEVYLDNEGKEIKREFSYSHTIEGTDWELYYIETGLYSGLVNTNGTGDYDTTAYVEDWGDSYGGFVIVDHEDNAFKIDSEGTLIAPSEGWQYADGTPIATVQVGSSDYANALPAYYNEDGVRVDVDADGLPINANTIANETVSWSEVGIEAISDYVLRITLYEEMTAWEVKGSLITHRLGVVHPENYDAGFNEDKTQTTYGNIDNPLMSYGPYELSEWADGQVFVFTRRDEHFASDEMDIKYIRFEVIDDLDFANDEFKAGRLDYMTGSKGYYYEYQDAPNIQLNPGTTFFRFAFNITGNNDYGVNPLLQDINFRKAMYYGFDRELFATDIRGPSDPTQGFLGDLYKSTDTSFASYRSSDAAKNVLSEHFPETYGYNREEAKRLFDLAYDKLVEDGVIQEGDTVTLDYKFYDVECGFCVYKWIEDHYEELFNEGESEFIFDFTTTAVSSWALNEAHETGNYEMTFGGWQGLEYSAPSMLGQVYNSNDSYMLEGGFNTADAPVSVSLPKAKEALTEWIAVYDALEIHTDEEDELYPLWTEMLSNFNGDVLETTFDELFEYSYGALRWEYEGKEDEFDLITASLEEVLLDQMIAIPLFTSVSSNVYSTRVKFEINEFNAFIPRYDWRYMYIVQYE